MAQIANEDAWICTKEEAVLFYNQSKQMYVFLNLPILTNPPYIMFDPISEPESDFVLVVGGMLIFPKIELQINVSLAEFIGTVNQIWDSEYGTNC